MDEQRYPYVNTGEVLEAKAYDTMARLRVKFDVLDGTFVGSVIMTVKAFRTSFPAFSVLNEGDRVEVQGHVRYDPPREEYPGSYYVDGRVVKVLEGVAAAQAELNMFKPDDDTPF